MELHDQRYIVGIDLGTTNSAVSFVDLQAPPDRQHIQSFAVPQLTGPGEVDAQAVLPSFLYIPGAYDIAADALTLPWPRPEDHFAGAFARDHGAKVPARLVSSAKSWLCHAAADRTAPILPWGAAGEEVAKVSPVAATAAYLSHIRNAWNTAHPEPEDALEQQVVIVTVPASFDEVARELTVDAAATAGLPTILLLEEPLAAFYSWLMRHDQTWRHLVQPNELILVCDVGGGTTDFTLIYLKADNGRLGFERIAVGDHLLLGGDNIDLALAVGLEDKLSGGNRLLEGDRWKTLCHQCRSAKEAILDKTSDTATITLLGSGGNLIGGTLTAKLARDDVIKTVLDGFFPMAQASAAAPQGQRKGISELGLPYESEPAITRHIGWFLEKHQAEVARYLGKDRPCPDLILFNGGSLKPAVIQERIQQAVGHWFGRAPGDAPRIMDNPTPDLAVSLGAAYYGLVKIGRGVRVGSGSPRAYYMAVARTEGDSKDVSSEALCLVERGLEEGTPITLADRNFEVLANQPVAFNIYSSSFRSGDRRGDLVTIDDTLTPLAPVQTIIWYGKKGAKTSIPVQIAAEYTEVGTLALWCRSRISDHQWKLQFQLRTAVAASDVSDQEIFDQALVDDACRLIRQAFADAPDSVGLDALAKSLGELVARPRDQWPLSFIRSLADELLDMAAVRQASPDHESRWLNLLGYTMRPGFADGSDVLRMKTIWKVRNQGLRFDNRVQVRNEWWILLRRVAGGMSPGQQRELLRDMVRVIMPKKGRPKRISPQERLEIWMAAANMELVQVADKIRLGWALLDELKPKKCRPQHFWSLSRIGARAPLYGPVDRVVPAADVSAWITRLLETDWRDPRPAGVAMAQMARRTGDRTRDLPTDIAERILAWMHQYTQYADYFEPHRRFVTEIVHRDQQEESVLFGETLPAGMVIRGD